MMKVSQSGGGLEILRHTQIPAQVVTVSASRQCLVYVLHILVYARLLAVAPPDWPAG